MITAKLQGRRLILTVTDDDGTAAFEPFVVEPVSARVGRELSSRYVLMIEGLPPLDPNGPTPQDDMLTAFGPDNFARADEELSLHEIELVSQAAYFWQTVGGMEAVQALLEVDPDGTQGGPESRGKALGVLLSRVVPLLQQIAHHLESVRPTRTGSTPATSTRSGGGTSADDSSSSLSNVPASLRRGSKPKPGSAPSQPTSD